MDAGARPRRDAAPLPVSKIIVPDGADEEGPMGQLLVMSNPEESTRCLLNQCALGMMGLSCGERGLIRSSVANTATFGLRRAVDRGLTP